MELLQCALAANMMIDTTAETQGSSETRNDFENPGSVPRRAGTSLLARWGMRGLLVLFATIVLATGAAFLSRAVSSPDDGPKLTHAITRGDLLVTVTEQGTLESSNNTEIKCKVRGFSTVTWVIPAGSQVKPEDILVRLDTKVIEEQFSLTKTNTFIATATLEQTKANVARAEIAVDAYREGRFRSQLQSLEKELEAKKRNLRTATKMHDRSERLFRLGYVTDLEVDGNAFTVTQAELELKVKKTEIKVLKEFTKQMEMETLRGNLTASKSKLAADEAGLAMEIKRRNRAEEELVDCVIKAETGGLVIYPSAAAWKQTPDITEGATVRKDQVLLLIPDLSKMQIKVGVHESIVERIKPGLKALVTLSDRTLEAKVSKVASVTRPAGWWTGNVVKYDTIIELPPDAGLKPGMSAEVELIMAVHKNVLTVPVAAVVETDKGAFCWVKTAEGTSRRLLRLGDSNDVFIVVKAGLAEGDKVVLNPTAFLEEAKQDALETLEETEPSGSEPSVVKETAESDA
ncbi:MAG: HlyD family efflux transporter periplasmic adaptor subunit [Planctomycetales bacterium]